MKAGLFVCDHVLPEFQSQFGDYPAMFADLFPEFDFHFYDVCNGDFPDNLDDCDVYLSTGSRYSVYNDLDWISRLKEVVRELYRTEQCFIGFCFGHQIIGEALGGKVGKSPKGWCVGVHEFEMQEQTRWLQPFQSSLNLLMSCQDQILQLPPEARVLAGNDQCPYAMIQLGEKMLGIQAHPEFSRSYNRKLMESRIKSIGEEVVEKAIESLEKPIHRDLIRNWVIQFIGEI